MYPVAGVSRSSLQVLQDARRKIRHRGEPDGAGSPLSHRMLVRYAMIEMAPSLLRASSMRADLEFYLGGTLDQGNSDVGRG